MAETWPEAHRNRRAAGKSRSQRMSRLSGRNSGRSARSSHSKTTISVETMRAPAAAIRLSASAWSAGDARSDRVRNNKDLEAVDDEVKHGLQDADVRLHAGDDHLRPSEPADAAGQHAVLHT